MRKLFLLAALLLLAPLAAKAQVYPAPPNVGLAANRPVNCVASNPGQPQEPQWYFATDTSVLSICVATNTWQNTTGGGGGGGIGGGGTAGFLGEWTNGTTIANSLCQDLSSVVLLCGESVSVGANALMISKPNAASGTTQFLAVTWDANRNALTALPGNSVRGIAGLGAGTSGTVQIAIGGEYPWTCDNQTVINDWLVLSTAGQCHDVGASELPGVQNIAQVAGANSGSGTATLADIFTPDTTNAPAGPPTVIQVNGNPLASTTANFNSTSPAAPANNVNLPFATDGLTPSGVSVAAPLATGSQAGFLELSTDLGGSYTAPNVVGIQGIPCTLSGTPVAGQVWGFASPTACQNLYLGVGIRTQSANTDTILTTDRTKNIRYTAASGATAVILPQAGTTGFTSNITFVLTNAQGSGTVTVTPTTSTINGASTLAIPAGQYAFVYSDNTNYFANLGTTNGGSSGVTSIATTSPITGGTITTTGTIGCASCVTESTGGAVPTSAHLLGTSSAPNLQPATRTDIDAIGYVAGGGTHDAQTATLAPAISGLTNGLQVCWLPTAANTGTTPTLAINGLTAKTIVKVGGAALVASDLTTTAIACAIYDGTNFELQNPQTAAAGSVTQSVPPELLVNGGASATSGNLAITKSNESPNAVWAGPISSGSSNLVQSNSAVNAGQGAISVPFSSNNSVGNLLVVIVTGNLATPTDTVGDSFTNPISLNQGTTLNLYYTCSAVGGANTVAVASAWSMQIYEFSGNPTSSCADATGSAHNSLATTSISQASGSVAQATELVFGVFNVIGGSVTSVAIGPGYSPLATSNPTTNNFTISGIGTATTGLSGAQTVTFTTNSGTGNYMVGIETFKLSTTGTSQPTFRKLVNGDFPTHTPGPIFRSTSTGQTSAISDTAMVVVGATAQLYRFTGEVNCDTSVSTATATLNLKWTDTSNTAQTLSAATLCTTLGSASVANIVVAIRAKAATTITYGATIANSPNYDVDVFLEQMN